MATVTIAGKGFGEPDSVIVLWNRDTDDRKKVRIKGRWLYVRKCRRDEASGGIVLPEKTRDNTVFALVLAVGDGCGKLHRLTKSQQALGMSFKADCGFQVNDKVWLPDDHTWGIQPSPYSDTGVERFIHEDVPLAVIEEGPHD